MPPWGRGQALLLPTGAACSAPAATPGWLLGGAGWDPCSRSQHPCQGSAAAVSAAALPRAASSHTHSPFLGGIVSKSRSQRCFLSGSPQDLGPGASEAPADATERLCAARCAAEGCCSLAASAAAGPGGAESRRALGVSHLQADKPRDGAQNISQPWPGLLFRSLFFWLGPEDNKPCGGAAAAAAGCEQGERRRCIASAEQNKGGVGHLRCRGGAGSQREPLRSFPLGSASHAASQLPLLAVLWGFSFGWLRRRFLFSSLLLPGNKSRECKTLVLGVM